MRWTENEYLQHLEQQKKNAQGKKASQQKPPQTPQKQKNATTKVNNVNVSKKTKNQGKIKTPSPEDLNLEEALSSLGLSAKILPKKTNTDTKKEKSKSKSKTKNAAKSPGSPKKRQGIDVAPIIQSLTTCVPQSMWGKDWLAINLDGARVLTTNDLFSILQYRKWEVFRYKKKCRELISRAIKNGPTNTNTPKPFFDGPTRLTLLRVGTNEMDNDSVPVAFKYFIDAVKKEKMNDKRFDRNAFIIDDDNPDIIVEIKTVQGKGEPRLGLLFERLPEEWKKKTVPSWKEWVNGHVGLEKAKGVISEPVLATKITNIQSPTKKVAKKAIKKDVKQAQGKTTKQVAKKVAEKVAKKAGQKPKQQKSKTKKKATPNPVSIQKKANQEKPRKTPVQKSPSNAPNKKQNETKKPE